jgi:hypothetical protein
MESGVGVADGGDEELRIFRGGVQAQSTLSAAEVDSGHGSVDKVGAKQFGAAHQQKIVNYYHIFILTSIPGENWNLAP